VNVVVRVIMVIQLYFIIHPTNGLYDRTVDYQSIGLTDERTRVRVEVRGPILPVSEIVK